LEVSAINSNSVKRRTKAGKGSAATGNSPCPLTESWLHERALRYLDRFDSSAANLRRVLRAAVQRVAPDPDEQQAAGARIEALVDRLQRSGVIDDARFAATSARGLRSRGGSTRLIRHKLRAKGVAEREVEAALGEALDEGTELDAAREHVRRKRLGPHRAPDERRARAQRDLAALARAGFSFDVARRALGDIELEDEPDG
jgi:regulatory protein